ncbi:MAG: response regulator transcription factor [Gemmatimonadota bacterium]|nr:MAG: response regulator transcription factor [Gemmatimonadota bacterium]
MKTKILLADDHKIVRDGLRSLLDKQSGMEVVGEAEDGRRALQLAAELTPDIVIMDIGMPNLNGMEATRHILDAVQNVKVIALSMHSDKRFVSGMLQAGASGYLLKDCAFEELAQAVETVLGGQIYLSPKITGVVVEDYVQMTTQIETSPLSLLTSREREVLQLFAEGKNTKEIAALLYVSVKTVETHRQRIMKKLNIHNIPDLVKFAIREGLTSLEN